MAFDHKTKIMIPTLKPPLPGGGGGEQKQRVKGTLKVGTRTVEVFIILRDL